MDFTDAQIKNCDFSRSIAVNCVFQQLKQGSNYQRNKFNLQGCRFEEAELPRTVFAFCDLSGVSFQKANLEEAIFENCLLNKTNFVGANLAKTGFGHSRVGETVLDLEGFLAFGQSQGFVLGS